VIAVGGAEGTAAEHVDLAVHFRYEAQIGTPYVKAESGFVYAVQTGDPADLGSFNLTHVFAKGFRIVGQTRNIIIVRSESCGKAGRKARTRWKK